MKVAIAGAGNVGRAIARELLNNGHHVLLIDRDPKALKMESVPNAEWIMADVCEIDTLQNPKSETGQDKIKAPRISVGKDRIWNSKSSCPSKSSKK